MKFAAITGWGKCMPPSVLSNADLATFLETDDEWITQRTGIHERRVSHVSAHTMATVAAKRALASTWRQSWPGGYPKEAIQPEMPSGFGLVKAVRACALRAWSPGVPWVIPRRSIRCR